MVLHREIVLSKAFGGRLAEARRCIFFIALIAGPLFVTGCRRQAAAPPPPPTPVVSVIQPVEHPVQEYLEYNGYLEAVETVQIRARVEGFLQDIVFDEGQEVKKGDLLFKVDPRETAAALKRAQADRAKAVAELTNASGEEARARRLLQSRNLSEEEYQSRLAAKESAEAAKKQAEAAVEAAEIQAGYTEIHAPIDGRISRTLVTRGNIVGVGEPTLLTTIVRPDPLFVYFDIPERDLVSFLRDRQTRDQAVPQTATVEVGISNEEGYPHRGTIDFQENRVETETGTVRLRGRIPNPPLPPNNVRILYPGLYARVRLPIGTPQPRLAIPEEALLTGQEGRFVYVVGKDDVIEKRTVIPGPVIWRMATNGAPGDAETSWRLEGPPPPAEPPPDAKARPRPGGPPGGKGPPGPKTKLPPPTLRSVISIQKGVSPDDRIVFNGIQRVRPGAPAKPEDWKLLKLPAAAPRNDAPAKKGGGQTQ